MVREWPLEADDFAAYYAYSPAALALRETVRLRAAREVALQEPILDVGCGDGLFARLAYPGKQIWGIDINPTEVRRAQASSSYQTLICGNVCNVHLPEAFFGSAIANCSLEHVPDLDGAFRNIRKSLKDEGTFVLMVPTPDWTEFLAVPELLKKAGFPSLARAYGNALDKVFHHVHLHDDAWWSERLAAAGFETIECRRIVARPMSWAFDLLLPASTVGWAVKKLTGRWVLSPALRPLTADFARNLIDRVADKVPELSKDAAGEYLIIARAVPGNGA